MALMGSKSRLRDHLLELGQHGGNVLLEGHHKACTDGAAGGFRSRAILTGEHARQEICRQHASDVLPTCQPCQLGLCVVQLLGGCVAHRLGVGRHLGHAAADFPGMWQQHSAQLRAHLLQEHVQHNGAPAAAEGHLWSARRVEAGLAAAGGWQQAVAGLSRSHVVRLLSLHDAHSFAISPERTRAAVREGGNLPARAAAAPHPRWAGCSERGRP